MIFIFTSFHKSDDQYEMPAKNELELLRDGSLIMTVAVDLC